MSQYENFSSLPPEKERAFAVYEKTSNETAKKAKKISVIVAAVFGVLLLIVVFSFEEPENKMAEDDMGMLEAAEDEAKEEATKPDTAEAAEAADDNGFEEVTGDSDEDADDEDEAVDEEVDE